MLKKNQFSLNRFDSEPYINSPLLKFRLSAIKRRNHNENMKRRAALVCIQDTIQCDPEFEFFFLL